MVDRSLHEMMIPASMLRELRDVGDFSSVDFQLDGVLAVTDQGRHAEQPQPLAPKHEWLQFGTPAVGLKWRQVPLENFLYSGKLKAETVHQQMRMTKLAREAFGREHANAAPDFLISQDELAGQNKDRHSFKGEEAKARGHAAKLQSCVRRMLLRQLYPWIHVSRLATYSDKSTTKRKKGSGRNKEFTEYGTGAGPSIPPPPELPWCSAWSSLEPSFELDPKTTLAMRKIVSDFESDNFESSLRRVDNLVLARGRGKLARPDRVLVELAALWSAGFGTRYGFGFMRRESVCV
ncbi:hypothetical protein T484DRAFT_2754818 [Baffinella frigidus]|nr:hypothetical protein T484DRAFT_2754818 [Cryptophyta sp. CCMP2293]